MVTKLLPLLLSGDCHGYEVAGVAQALLGGYSLRLTALQWIYLQAPGRPF